MKCSRCGAENQSGKQQCYLCGSPLQSKPFHTMASNSPQSPASNPGPAKAKSLGVGASESHEFTFGEFQLPDTGPLHQGRNKDTQMSSFQTMAEVGQSPSALSPPSSELTEPSTPSLEALRVSAQSAQREGSVPPPPGRPEHATPLGMGRNTPYPSRQRSQETPAPPLNFDEKTVVDSMENIERIGSAPSMSQPSQSVLASHGSSVNLAQSAPLPVAPLRASQPSATSAPPHQDIQPMPSTTQDNMTQAAGPLESPASPRLSRAEGLPQLPRPRLPDGFSFACKAQIPALWRRGISGFIDFTLLLGLTLLLCSLFGPKSNQVWPKGLHIVDLIVVVIPKYQAQLTWGGVAFVVTFVLYSMIMHSLLGKTIGKLLLGIRVVTSTGRPIGWIASFARAIAFLMFTALNLVGLLWILIDQEFRGLHDRVSGSIVVQDNPAYPLPSK